jgi:hypothetical protein
MRWLMFVLLPICLGTNAFGSNLRVEIGVLSCTVGLSIDPPMSDQTGADSEARDMLCSFMPSKNQPAETYAGGLKAISAGGGLPEVATFLWTVRAPLGTQFAGGLLQQSYTVDPSTPPGQAAPLIGERHSDITLHTMSEQEEGSASREKPQMLGFTITALELKLKASTS